MEAMEEKVTSAVIEQSQLMHDKHDLALACKKMGLRLKETNEKACAALEKLGHDLHELPVKYSNGDECKGEDEAEADKKNSAAYISDSLIESAANSSRLIDYLTSEGFGQRSDDRGYKRSWEGVSRRITEEMRECFPSTSNTITGGVQKVVSSTVQGEEEHVQQEEKAQEEERRRKQEDLKIRLAALAQIIIAFGEYVPAKERTYLPPLIKHIRQQAPGSSWFPWMPSLCPSQRKKATQGKSNLASRRGYARSWVLSHQAVFMSFESFCEKNEARPHSCKAD